MPNLSRRRYVWLEQDPLRRSLTEAYYGGRLLHGLRHFKFSARCSPLDVRAPPLPGSSTSILSSLGVFDSSAPDPSLSWPLLRLGLPITGGLKFSTVLCSKSPPLAVRSSRISRGGGSRLCKVLISYAL